MLLLIAMAMIVAMSPVALVTVTVATRVGYEPYLEG